MLNRSQLNELPTLFYRSTGREIIPKDVMRHIRWLADASFDPKSDIAIALQHTAFGNPDKLKVMLDVNPRLVLEAGNVVDPAGNTIIGVTLYEFILGAGDANSDITSIIFECFSKIKDGGKNERARQYARYKSHIDAMPTQKPDFDFNELLEVVMEASVLDVQDALGNKDGVKFQHNSKLNDTLAAFRKRFSPRIIKSGMHFNYANFEAALQTYVHNYERLQSAPRNLNHCHLFFRQVLGYLQRGLPAWVRQAFAQGLLNILDKGQKLERTFKLKLDEGEFPYSLDVHSHTGLGFDYVISWLTGQRGHGGRPGRGIAKLNEFLTIKNNMLIELAQPDQPHLSSCPDADRTDAVKPGR